MSAFAFTVGYADAYDPDLRAVTLESPLIKRGRYPGYDGGWVWPTAAAAREFLTSDLFDRDPAEYAVYEIELPSGWLIDVSPGPHSVDGVHRLLHDARILARVS